MDDEQGDVTEVDRRVGEYDRREQAAAIALRMLRELHESNTQQYIATREEVQTLREQLASIKGDVKAHQQQLDEHEKLDQRRMHGERGDNGLTGRVSALERRVGSQDKQLNRYAGIGGVILTALGGLVLWAYRSMLGGP